MNKADLIKVVAAQTEYAKKDVESLVEEVFTQITAALVNGEKVSISGFGDFETRKREARTGRNPQTGEPVEIAEKRVPAFKAKKALKEAVK
ncbi:MAG: HU family DNA-binding protein [Bacillota bacterium]